MKRTLLLILSVMAFAGISVAQDVYTSGYYYNDDYKEVAAVYKNREMIFSTGDTPSFEHESTDVLLLDGDVYWVDNCTDANHDNYYSRVMRNNEVFLEIPVGAESHISCLFTDGMDVYAAGNMLVSGHQKPMVWKNTNPTPYLNFDATNYYYGYLYDAMMVEGKVIACGCVYDNNISGHVGVIWHENDGEMYVLNDYLVLLSMDYYNGSVYTAAWGVNGYIGAAYQDTNELYTLTTNGSANAICVDAGNVYVGVYDRDSEHGSIWKNGEKLYDLPRYAGTECIVANSEGVYYAADGRIWKNGLALYSFGFENAPDIQGMYVDLDCQNNNIRTLPYFEGFETGATDWECWYRWDEDQTNNGYASYWHRGGGSNSYVNAYSGEHCALHIYNAAYDQFGLLSTPMIRIPVGGNTTMTFKTLELYPYDYGYEGVWVIEGGHKAAVEVWTQTTPTEEWKTVTIDLSAFQGRDVEIDFRYKGQNAHNWYIDDVSITSNVGVDETNNESLAICPNPARESFRIPGLEDETKVFIYNVLGELVKTANVNANQEIGVGELSAGLYLVRCGNTTLRFVKE